MRAATTTPTGTAATVQKLMQVFIPISVLFSGLVLPARCAALLVHQQHLDAGAAGLHQQVPPARRPKEVGAGRRGRQDAGPEARAAPGARSPHRTAAVDGRCRRCGQIADDARAAPPPRQHAPARAAPNPGGNRPRRQAAEPGQEAALNASAARAVQAPNVPTKPVRSGAEPRDRVSDRIDWKRHRRDS